MKFVVLFAIAFLLLSFSCSTTDPPPPPPEYVRSIELSPEDASCTEAWLRVRITDGSSPPFDIRLHRDGDSVQTLRLSTADSLIIDESLLPNRQYTYMAYRLTDSRLTDSSTLQTLTTVDTTSHDWVFDPPVLLGEGGSSVLYDVAIVSTDPPLAYAVGAIYLAGDPQAYNMARWDGSTWELMRIQFFTICGQSGTTPYPAKAIFAFSANDIWITSQGGQVARWDGTTQTATTCMPDPFVVNKLWGEDPNSVWAVGNNGGIAHYQNGTWRRLESGTDVSLLDMWGSPDGSVVWACGYYSDRLGTFLLRWRGTSWEIAYDGTASEFQIRLDSLSGAFTSVYTPRAGRIFVGSSAGVYLAPETTHGEGKRLSFTATFFPGFPRRLRGNDLNDFIIVGDYSFLAHFNGMTWRYFSELRAEDIVLSSVAQRQGLIIAVGDRYHPINSKGIIITLRRQPL